MRHNSDLILKQLVTVHENTIRKDEEPELKNLTLEGVSLTLKDVNLNMPKDLEEEAAKKAMFKTAKTLEERFLDL